MLDFNPIIFEKNAGNPSWSRFSSKTRKQRISSFGLALAGSPRLLMVLLLLQQHQRATKLYSKQPYRLHPWWYHLATSTCEGLQRDAEPEDRDSSAAAVVVVVLPYLVKRPNEQRFPPADDGACLGMTIRFLFSSPMFLAPWGYRLFLLLLVVVFVGLALCKTGFFKNRNPESRAFSVQRNQRP